MGSNNLVQSSSRESGSYVITAIISNFEFNIMDCHLCALRT